MDADTTKKLKNFNEEFAEFCKNTRFEGHIEFPIEVSKVDSQRSREIMMGAGQRVGCWVSVRPCAADCEGKTFLGVYLGDLTFSIDHWYNLQSNVLCLSPHTNPAIFVPDLKRVVWGCESWWDVIDSPEKLRKISDADIQNVWYVRALKELMEKQDDAKPTSDSPAQPGA